MTGPLRWEVGLPDDFVGLSSAVLSLTKAHWERIGATFSDDESDPDWPQRMAVGSIPTLLEPAQRFAILDEGDVTTLLIGGEDARRSLRAMSVLAALASHDQVDPARDVLQFGIGEEDGIVARAWRAEGEAAGTPRHDAEEAEALAELRGRLEAIKCGLPSARSGLDDLAEHEGTIQPRR